MNPKPIFGSLQSSGNESKVTAISYASGMVYVGGSMKDPTLSPVAPVGSPFTFIGAYNSSTMLWDWLLVDPYTSGVVKSISKSGSFLLVAVESGGTSKLYIV